MGIYPEKLARKVLVAPRRTFWIAIWVLILQACIPLGVTQTVSATTPASPTITQPQPNVTQPRRPTFTPQITVTEVVSTRSLTLAPAATLHFAGYDWQVRSRTGGPGPNIWDPANAWVDVQGALHLKLSHVGSEWHSVELNSTQRFGFGTYTFDVSGAIDQFDPNVVLGLYTYPPADVGPDKTNEIDIEMARWGAAKNPNGNYTVWPVQAGLKQASKTYEFKLTGSKSTHQFVWTSRSIAFQSVEGSAGSHAAPYAAWNDQPAEATQYIPQKPVPLNFNLWLFQGNPPANGQEVEIVITRFTFTPLTVMYLPLVRR
jgi:hypothetical protein